MKWACLVVLIIDLLLTAGVGFRYFTSKADPKSREATAAKVQEMLEAQMAAQGVYFEDESGEYYSDDEDTSSSGRNEYDVTDDLEDADYNKTNQEGLDDAKKKIGLIGKKH